MTPPPENERGGHSDTLGKIIFDLNKSYFCLLYTSDAADEL